jgi:membrane protease YdiL (CAAX protease family)
MKLPRSFALLGLSLPGAHPCDAVSPAPPRSGTRLRAPLLVLFWSFGLYIVILFTQYLGAWLAMLSTGAGFGAIMSGTVRNPRSILGLGLAGGLVGIPWCLLVVRWLWRRSRTWMGTTFDGSALAWGFLLGVLLPLIVTLALGALGVARPTATPSRMPAQEALALVMGQLGWALFVGLAEEHVYRGMAVREWAVRMGWLWATLLGGGYFALVHAGSLGGVGVAEVVQFLIGAQAANFMFVALYRRGGCLWLPIGLHAGWNFALEGLVGATMSGRPALGLMRTELSGPVLLTGGGFGLEVSAVAILVYVAVGLVALRWRRPMAPAWAAAPRHPAGREFSNGA